MCLISLVAATVETSKSKLEFCTIRLRKKGEFSVKITQHTLYTTMSWGCWKHPFGIPGVRPMFLKPKLHKESKNGFKTISCRCYPVMIFSKNYFRCKKIIKNNGCFVDFWIFMAIYMDKLDLLKYLIAGHSESVEILPKC